MKHRISDNNIIISWCSLLWSCKHFVRRISNLLTPSEWKGLLRFVWTVISSLDANLFPSRYLFKFENRKSHGGLNPEKMADEETICILIYYISPRRLRTFALLHCLCGKALSFFPISVVCSSNCGWTGSISWQNIYHWLLFPFESYRSVLYQLFRRKPGRSSNRIKCI